jgi:hypothetical protein
MPETEWEDASMSSIDGCGYALTLNECGGAVAWEFSIESR